MLYHILTFGIASYAKEEECFQSLRLYWDSMLKWKPETRIAEKEAGWI